MVGLVPIDRPLGVEIKKVLSVGNLSDANCWHVATALHLAADPAELSFVTLDLPQRAIARALGFKTS